MLAAAPAPKREPGTDEARIKAPLPAISALLTPAAVEALVAAVLLLLPTNLNSR